MKKLNKRKVWLVACVTVLVTCGLLLVADKKKVMAESRDNAKEVYQINYDTLRQYTQGLALGVLRITKTYSLDSTSIKKIDFSYPDQDTYGDDPKYEIFNPLGADVPPFSNVSKHYSHFSENPRLIFTFGNRVKNMGTDQTELIVVVPNIRPEACPFIQKYIHKYNDLIADDVVKILKQNPSIVSYPKEVSREEAQELSFYEGCVQAPDGFYYYRVLYER